ncbi:Wall-associated receptor kinase [Musa troglodytarum]|uniref:Wall-associated receptor kinase n=1 Tax=Musa troglodytarum TaxID=320322 RepID=A0A9E7JJJ0_9LILI|nr:Wall-associated receptor kinase [Musa troglodytarum]
MIHKLPLLLLLPITATAAMAFGQNCTRRCSNIDVPYPFGIEPDCYRDGFDLSCNETESKLYLGNIEVIDIDVLNGQARVYKRISWDCNNSVLTPKHTIPMNLTGWPFTFSDTRNKFTAIGCDTIALFVGATNNSYSTGCVSICNKNTTFSDGSCSGAGCCQTSILPGLQYFNITFSSFNGHKDNSWDNPCSFAFLVDGSWYSFRTTDLNETDFYDRNDGRVPMVLDWSIGDDVGCEEAPQNLTSYACRSNNSFCLNATNGIGYLCNCSSGYQGNPYVEGGCEDINECDYPNNYTCHGLCTNLPGNYSCACPQGTRGHGHVFKGILSDQRVVAIKRPNITNETEIAQFVNEVRILSQTNHRNVVKFFGCCLQTQVPYLVFEFISGGTLSDHLLGVEGVSPLSFEDRLRIATEVAKALSYLHTEASMTIFHRDIKSSNILLDERNTAKLADFGASRSVSLEQTSIATAVQGTFGYLDPEYHQTGRLTEKSDVYSFGVILAELLTGKLAIPRQENNVVRHLVMDFLVALKENSLFKVLDPLVLKEGSREAVEKIARLVERCLKLSGNDRPTMREVEDELEAVRSKKTKADDTMVSGKTTTRGGAASSETIRRIRTGQHSFGRQFPNDDGTDFSNTGIMSDQGGTTTSTEAIGTSSTMQYSVEMELALLGEMPR